MLMVNQVNKSYGKTTVLEDISLEFANGVFALLAPNGAGKTTLIKMLATLLYPSKGEILYDGQDIYSMGERYRALVGYLPQEFGYYKNYSPVQYLEYISALKGLTRQQAKERIPQLLDLVALSDVSRKRMGKFSGGMLQRVGIAQAMLNDPRILILDEPTAGLDPKERARFRNLLSDLSRDRTVLLSTHIVSDVESIANEIIMIKDKKVLYKDSIAAICSVLEGKVFETSLDFSKTDHFRKHYLSLSERQEHGKMRIRFIADSRLSVEWEEVVPTLEDVFLHEYQDTAGKNG